MVQTNAATNDSKAGQFITRVTLPLKKSFAQRRQEKPKGRQAVLKAPLIKTTSSWRASVRFHLLPRTRMLPGSCDQRNCAPGESCPPRFRGTPWHAPGALQWRAEVLNS